MTTITASSNAKKYTKINATGDSDITVTDGNFKIYGGRGDDTITLGSGDNIVFAQAGDNTIVSGSGNNKLYAGKGEDNFVYDGDFGKDVIYKANSQDMITFGDSFDDTEFSFYRKGSNLIITDNIDSSENTIVLSKYFKSKSKLDDITHNGVIEKISDQLIYYTGKGRIKGTRFNDGIVGSDKKDRIYSYSGDDYILGGKANDKIHSGKGDNTIVVNNGDGHDILYVNKKATSNTLMFDEGNQLSYSKSGKDLIVSAKVATAEDDNPDNVSVRVKNYFTKKGDDAIKSVINVQYAGSETVNNIVDELTANGVTITGKLNKANKIYGAENYDNYITGGNKSDKIYAGEENNEIYGGKGNDKYYVTTDNRTALAKIFDESGNDTYYVKNLDTSVYINDASGNKDVLKISDKGAYTLFFDVSVSEDVAQYDSLFIVANDNLQYEDYHNYTAGGVEIGNFFDDDKYGDGRIEKITAGGKKVDTTLTHFDEIRSNVATWLTQEAHAYNSAMDAFQNSTPDDIRELISIYQGNSVPDIA